MYRFMVSAINEGRPHADRCAEALKILFNLFCHADASKVFFVFIDRLRSFPEGAWLGNGRGRRTRKKESARFPANLCGIAI